MSTARPRLTPEVQQQICAYLRAGGGPHVAAAAAGVLPEAFDEWLRRGRRPGARPRYRDFALAVAQAQAHARLAAETKVHQEKPLDWLKCGPGRETAEQQGWTAPGKPCFGAGTADEEQVSRAEWFATLADLLAALAAYPDARAAAARALEQPESKKV
jgi:hypothetical protein